MKMKHMWKLLHFTHIEQWARRINNFYYLHKYEKRYNIFYDDLIDVRHRRNCLFEMHVHFMVGFAVHTRIQPLDAMIQREKARASKAKKRICSFEATVVPTHTHILPSTFCRSLVRVRESVCEHCLLSAIKYGAILPFSHFERLHSAYIIFHRTILFAPCRTFPPHSLLQSLQIVSSLQCVFCSRYQPTDLNSLVFSVSCSRCRNRNLCE